MFGSMVYIHTDDDKRLNNKSFPATFLGYGPYTAVILYWNRTTNYFGLCHQSCINDKTSSSTDVPAQILLVKYVTSTYKPLQTNHILY